MAIFIARHSCNGKAGANYPRVFSRCCAVRNTGTAVPNPSKTIGKDSPQLAPRATDSARMRTQRGVVDPNEGDAPAKITWRRLGAEDEILAVLAAPRTEGEQHDAEFRRKERRLGDIFAALNAVDSLELQRRLALRLPEDELAIRFAQMASDRQGRLIAFLIASRRRFAVPSRNGANE